MYLKLINDNGNKGMWEITEEGLNAVGPGTNRLTRWNRLVYYCARGLLYDGQWDILTDKEAEDCLFIWHL